MVNSETDTNTWIIQTLDIEATVENYTIKKLLQQKKTSTYQTTL